MQDSGYCAASRLKNVSAPQMTVRLSERIIAKATYKRRSRRVSCLVSAALTEDICLTSFGIAISEELIGNWLLFDQLSTEVRFSGSHNLPIGE